MFKIMYTLKLSAVIRHMFVSYDKHRVFINLYTCTNLQTHRVYFKTHCVCLRHCLSYE